MSFLPFRHSVQRSFTKTVVTRYLGHKIACDARTGISCHEADQGSFEAAGLRPAVVASLHAAFPNIRKPTSMQRKLIRAMTKNRDVLLQDDTGTGKSFAAMLALLNKLSGQNANPGVSGDTERLTGLLIVPHRDLAYQYLHWIHHMTLPAGDAPLSLMKYAQVLVRHVNKSTLQALPLRMQEAIKSASSDQDLLHKPPHVLIATPNALLELIERRPEVLTPSIVVVDEVDALLRIPSNKPLKGQRGAREQLGKHTPDLVRVLDRIYSASRDRSWTHRRVGSVREGTVVHDRVAATHGPQLIMISATLRNRLRSALFSTFGWVRREETLTLIRKRTSSQPAHRLGRSAVHHVLVVSKTGDIKNIVGAGPLPQDTADDAIFTGNDDAEGMDEEGRDVALYDGDDGPELVGDVDKALLRAPLMMDPAILEAIAAAFALDVPRVALLVLPASAAVRKIIFELQQLGVDAHPLDLATDEASRAHVLARADEISDENPVLIVATLATVRGIDLPGLTHVFMAGVPEGRSGDAYLHVAGRVGRFGRRGKVVTIVEERREERIGNRVVVTDGAKKMANLFSRIGVRASRLAHFE